MAKQKGILKISGSIGGMTFYQRKGKDLIKVTTGPSKETIENNPKFKRTRENNQEFGGATKAGKGLRMGFVEVQSMLDSELSNRVVKLFREMISLSPGVRGQRPFLPVAHKEKFTQLVLQTQSSFESIFLAPYSVTMPTSRNEATITLPDFNSSNLVAAPQGATHFRIINHISVLSAYEYDTTIKQYQPTEPLRNSMHASEVSGYFPVSGMVGATTTLRALLYDVDELPVDSVLLICLGVQFFQQVNGSYYELASHDALKIVQAS